MFGDASGTAWDFANPTIFVKITFHLLSNFLLLHEWKDNGEKLHKPNFKVTWIISF